MGALIKVLAELCGMILKGVRWVLRCVITALGFIWRKFAGYCERHSYKPRSVVCVMLVIVLLAAGAGAASVWIDRQKAITSGLGLMNIGELATQAYHYRAVDTIEKSQELWGWEVPLTGAQSIFSYEGIIRAGYDFEDIGIDVDYDNKCITVTLPEPYIINNDILSDSLMVYSEDTNIFTPISIEDFNDTQADMRVQGETDAIATGIFESARTNVEVLIKGFLSGAFDLNEFEIVFQ